jgi:hypothetical protein
MEKEKVLTEKLINGTNEVQRWLLSIAMYTVIVITDTPSLTN